MNILAIGAHHDDIELGCGGTLARMVREGHTAFGMVLTNSETHYDIRSIHRTTETAVAEAKNAAGVIGYTLIDIHENRPANGTLTYDVGLMRHIEQFIADNTISFVFSHWRSDLNTDHEAAAKMTIVAARHVPSVLMYRSNWYQPALPFNGVCHVDISSAINLKKQSLACYKSEIGNRGTDWIDSFIDQHRTAGFGFGVSYAEVFEPVKVQLFGV